LPKETTASRYLTEPQAFLVATMRKQAALKAELLRLQYRTAPGQRYLAEKRMSEIKTEVAALDAIMFMRRQ